MTILEALNRIEILKPNGYSHTEQIKWLSTLDGNIKNNIIDTHEVCQSPSCRCRQVCGEDIAFTPYSETDLTKEMLVPAPYDEVYIHWIEAKIDYANGEYAKYQNSKTMYNDAFSDFERYYNRTHMPKGNKLKFS